MIISREVLKEYPIVGEGGQGIVYKIDEDRVVKLSENINLELLKAMIKIDLKQFLKPIDEVYEEELDSEPYAFAYPFIDKNKQIKAYLLEKENLINNIDALTEDIIKLSKKRIIISDVIPINSFCIDEKIYMCDFDLYSFADDSLTEEQIIKINMYKLEVYFKKLWMLALVANGIDRYSIRFHPEYFEKNHIETIKEKMNNRENIKEYIKRSVI